MLLTVLMILDALIAIVLIAAVLGQEAKSDGMGGLGGGADTVFSSKARGMDALLAIVQMPPGIPVATVGIDGALNAAILAAQIMATADENLRIKLADYKENLKNKIVKANEELKEVKYKFKCPPTP